jgi:hypothetical protein
MRIFKIGIAALLVVLAGTVAIDRATVTHAEGEVCVPTPTGTVSWWPLNESFGTTAFDTVDGNDGTLIDGPLHTPGLIGEALDFNGFSQYVDVPDAANLDITDELTLEAWIKPDTASIGGIITKFGSGNGYGMFYRGGLGGRVDGWFGDGLAFHQVLSPGSIPLGVWTHMAFTYDGTDMNLYVDGALVNSVSPASGPIAVNDVPITIGARGVAARNQHFDGTIDEPTVYDRVLTPAEIASIASADVAGKCSPSSFSDLDVDHVNLKFGDEQGVDSYSIKGGFDLTDVEEDFEFGDHDLRVLFGTSRIMIPAGSFVEKGNSLRFAGSIGGSDVRAEVRMGKGSEVRFEVDVDDLDLEGTGNVVEIGLAFPFSSGIDQVRLSGVLSMQGGG